jgi:hypothetical protein
MSSLPATYLAKKLTEPLPIKGGGVLRTIADASEYMLALPHEHAEFCARWRHAAKLILEQADVVAVSRQVRLVLFYDVQLDIRQWAEMLPGTMLRPALR